MKAMRKFVSVVCLLGVSGIVVPGTHAQQETSGQSASPTAKTAADATFRGVKVADAKGKQTDAILTFSDDSKKLVVRIADRDYLTIPYDQVDKVSYEYTKKHRITQGAIVMAASLGAGAVVMMTKSKSHWLYIDFHEQGTPKSVVLRMDKNSYKSICEAVKTHTGIEVGFPKDVRDRARKEENKEEGNGSAQ